MKSGFRSFVLAGCALLGLVGPARAMDVTFGTSWDGPGYTLQAIVDAVYGAGQIDVATDYIGHDPGELDPWFWVAEDRFSALLIREVAGNANRNVLGWYKETGAQPAITGDGVHDGIVFDGPAFANATAVVMFPTRMTKFGFYLDPDGPNDVAGAPQPEVFFTNRLYNDPGPDGSGALHAPFGGDAQALVYDISSVVGVPNTWLVAFEDLDSGFMPKPPYIGTDNDYNDFVFEVHALGATPISPLTLGQLKARYAR